MLAKETKKKISGKIYIIETSANTYYFNNSIDFLNKVKVFSQLGITHFANIIGSDNLKDYSSICKVKKLKNLECLVKAQQLI